MYTCVCVCVGMCVRVYVCACARSLLFGWWRFPCLGVIVEGVVFSLQRSVFRLT